MRDMNELEKMRDEYLLFLSSIPEEMNNTDRKRITREFWNRLYAIQKAIDEEYRELLDGGDNDEIVTFEGMMMFSYVPEIRKAMMKNAKRMKTKIMSSLTYGADLFRDWAKDRFDPKSRHYQLKGIEQTNE